MSEKKLFKIKNWITGKVIFSCEAESLKECVEKAVKEKNSLSEANLSGANLIGANLSEADLRKTDLRKTDLWKADLRKADLRGANLSGADLNAIFYLTKISEEQKGLIMNSDLFEVEKE